MRVDQAQLLAFVLLILTSVIGVQTVSLGAEARLVPTYVVGVALVLLICCCAAEYAASKDRIPGGDETDVHDCDGPRPEATVIAWVALLPALVFLFGLPVAVGFFVYLYARRWSGWPRSSSLLLGGGLAACVYAVARLALQGPVPPGWLWTLA